ncbi:BlaI/MecI/CopY family transcriptional regulator [Tissierella praeacuta]|uniref:BlaI/MecI/CopY family transcriptional regulator n=1 Tax=Tissierella praeacuta TaxID=43131 RepID=UPI001C0FDBE1|nr:BlaI/MecI/CopY family transcriptional regulator [Tissierella praeacuta]MBU5255778.1 BlaI/MecI/CopY family transcriptional regulator [Tissierella praeacuta]
MLRQNNHFKLTNRELDILNILWTAEKPLLASDIPRIDNSISINTAQAVLRKLLKKNLIEVADIVYSGTVLSRSYQPTISSNDFSLQQFVKQFQNLNKSISIPSIVATLLEHEKNEKIVIEELEKMLKERKKLLKGED